MKRTIKNSHWFIMNSTGCVWVLVALLGFSDLISRQQKELEPDEASVFAQKFLANATETRQKQYDNAVASALNAAEEYSGRNLTAEIAEREYAERVKVIRSRDPLLRLSSAKLANVYRRSSGIQREDFQFTAQRFASSFNDPKPDIGVLERDLELRQHFVWTVELRDAMLAKQQPTVLKVSVELVDTTGKPAKGYYVWFAPQCVDNIPSRFHIIPGATSPTNEGEVEAGYNTFEFRKSDKRNDPVVMKEVRNVDGKTKVLKFVLEQ